MAKSGKGKVPGGKGPEREDPKNRASTHQHNWSGREAEQSDGTVKVWCTCGKYMGRG